MSFVSRIFFNIIYYIKLAFSFLNIPAFVYDTVITKPLTKYTYIKLYNELIQKNGDSIKKILDIGTGTGYALESIIDYLPKTNVVGIDIDQNYVKAAKKRFANRANVQIRGQNFYELENSKERYDLIIFSSSFMLMPYREKALEVAKSLLNKNGKIVFLMTLYENKKKFKFVEKIKPYLKYYTTIDFGNITYETNFVNLLQDSSLKILKKERIFYKLNPLFKIFRIFYVETEVLLN